MMIRKLLGQIMVEEGFVTRQQLNEALQKRNKIKEKTLREEMEKGELFSAAQLSIVTDKIPSLGQIMTGMGLVTKEQLEEALKEQDKYFEVYRSLENDKLGIAIEIGSLINSTLDLAKVLQLIMIHVNRVTNSVASTLMLLDEKTGELVFCVPTGPEADKLTYASLPPGEGIAGWVAKHEQPVIVPDAKKDSRFCPKIDKISGIETKSILGVPLKAKTKLIGVLEVINKVDGTSFTKEDELFLSIFGYQAAVAIENARLHGELKDRLSESKQAEEALRESEQRLKTILDSTQIGVVIVDPENHIIVDVNPAAVKMIDAPNEDVVGRECFNYICPAEKGQCPITDLGLHFDNTEKILLTAHGNEIPILKSVIPVTLDGREHLLESFMDITKVKETEQERTRLAKAVDQAAEGVIITDRDGTIRYINPAFERLSGFTRKDIFGQNVYILKSDKHDKAFYNKMWDIISRGEVWTGRITNRMKNGTLREFETTISPIRDSSGVIVDFVFVKRDVTHEVQLQTRLQQAQKMEAIGTLAGGIAHDFNNILTSIIGFAELAMYKLPEGDEIRSDLDYVIKSGYRAKELVKQILSFSRRNEQDIKPVQIHLIIKEALKLLRASLPATIEIHQNIEFEFDVVLADPTQIHQVLMNLCTNAAHAMKKSGGVLEVSLTEVDLDSVAVSQYPGLNPGPYLELSISDTGHGMDNAVMERIFDPFFTTKKQGEGTGMGLSVVHGIVKSHGGFIFVNSEIEKGTKFHVFLPVIEKTIASEVQAEEAMPKGNERIMFVDDEVMLVTMAQEMLEFLGYEVVVRTSSIEALEAFRAQPDKFDLVITDKTMPQMTGFDLAKELREVRPDIPIILCTGFSETIETEMAKAMSINAYIMKPLAMQEMAAAVRKVLDK